MKLILSQTEAADIIRQRLSLPLSVAVQIVEDGELAAQPIAPQLSKLVSDIDSLIKRDLKITAIRDYRNFAGVGLWEAKNAVERWEQPGASTRLFILTHNRLPTVMRCPNTGDFVGLE